MSARKTEDKMARAHLFIYGRAQGIGFRFSTSRKAHRLGIFGWVRNLPDGRLEAIFEGEKGKIEEIVQWAKTGPIGARVDNVEIEWQKYTGEFANFEIKY